MSSSELYQKIVKYRQDHAAPLKDMHDKAKSMHEALQTIMSSRLVNPKPASLSKLIDALNDFRNDISNKYERFSNGLVTVSIAGLEKSGKTTFLQKLTGIDELPTHAQRCTSVASEIICVDSSSQEKFVIEYYNHADMLENIKAMLNDMHSYKEKLWAEGREQTWDPLPTSLDAFKTYFLPEVEDIHPFLRASFCNTANNSGTLLQLKAIQRALDCYINKLGTTDEGRDLGKLAFYMSHKTKDNPNTSELQPLIQKLSIYKNYSQEMGSLRLCDTPGVDDPNPQAQRRALNSIDTETDLLIIASRPGNKPSATGLHHLLANLKNLDKGVPWRERSLFLINWDKDSDPTGAHAGTHKDEIVDDKTFDNARIKGPYDIMNDKEARDTFMSEVYQRLIDELPSQDKQMMARFERIWKEDILTDFYNIVKHLRQQAPPMEDKLRDKLTSLFSKWFRNNSKESSPSQYFMGRLKTMFGRKTQHIGDNEELKRMRETIQRILAEEYDNLTTWLENEASEECCAELLDVPSNAVDVILPKLSHRFTEIVHRVVGEVTYISPLVQKEVLSVLRYALGQDVAEQLCGSENQEEQKQLAALQEKMECAAQALKDDSVSFIAEQLKEFSNLSVQMGYILRHELRPCLNLLNPHHWKSSRKQTLIEKSCKIIKNATDENVQEDRNWLASYKEKNLPAMDASPQEHSEFLHRLAYCVCSILDALVNSNEGQLEELVEDYIEQASQTLGSQNLCEDGWQWGLYHYKHIILSEQYNELERRSADSAEYNEMLKMLENVI